MAGLDAAFVHFGKDAHSAGDLSRFGLGAAHAAQARGDEQLAGQVAFGRDAQELAARIEDGVERAVDDALGADVHPAAGGHLAIVGNAHLLGDLPIVDVVEHAHHQGVGQNNAGRLFFGGEQAHRVAGFNDQRLVVPSALPGIF